MTSVQDMVTDHLDIWTSAIEIKSTQGRGRSKKRGLYGINKLRQLILELAVRGKLVPQDPDDEPASELLKKMAAEKAHLIKDNKIKKTKVLGEISEDEKPFDLPQGWEWVRLGDIALQVTDGVHHTPNYLDQGVPFISVKDIDGTTVSFDNCKYISKEQHIQINARCNPELGDILICRIGTLGRVTIVDTSDRFSLFVSVGLLKFIQKYYLPRFAHLTLHSPLLLNQFDEIKAGGSHTNKLNLGDIPRLKLPIPPLAEQHRIVAKVDELMALCDQLERQSEGSLAAHVTLVETMLGTLTQSQSAEVLAENWARAAEHFDTLFTTEHSIEQLKQTILQLAVMGKLVNQDSKDEPAIELLRRIEDAKNTLKMDTNDRRVKQTPWPEISDLNMSLPPGWAAQSFENLFLFIDYRGNTPPKTEAGIPLITAKNIRMGRLNREPREYVSEPTFRSWMTRGLPKLGDLFFTTEAPLGNVCLNVIDEPFALAQRAINLQTYGEQNTKFLMFALMSNFMQTIIYDNSTGMTARGIKAAKLKPIPIPIPPAQEQARIVAIVDELMALCDQLKAHVGDAQVTQQHLADVIVERALATEEAVP